MIQNPILRGFYPDPSICRVGDDFYLVTSSFSYFPGVPIFHSRDLVHWEQIGHVLDRPSQLPLTYENISGGIFAPTIRYHEGTFYMITTNMTTRENFIVTAADPAGPWSDPIVIPEAKGIDPSLFFDDDGKVYFCGTAGGFGDTTYDHQVIGVAQIDVTTGKFIGEQWAISDGFGKHCASPEAPHIYKKDGWYYLIIAEGGTEHYHAVTVFRSKDIHQWFEEYPGNPILTHRHLGKEYPICNVGHADIVDTPYGDWYMVALASRLVNGYHKPLGRETFLMPMTWEDGWPVVCPGEGHVSFEYPDPVLPESADPWTPEEDRVYVNPSVDDFSEGEMSFAWNYLGTPWENYVTFENDALAMQFLPRTLVPTEFEGDHYDFFHHLTKCGKTRECMPFMGRRLQSFDWLAQTSLTADLSGGESVGVAILQNNACQVRLELTDRKASVIQVEYQLVDGNIHYEQTILGETELPAAEDYTILVRCCENHCDFAVEAGEDRLLAAEDVSLDFLGSETAGGFVGAYIGMFATSNGRSSKKKAYFKNFLLKNR